MPTVHWGSVALGAILALIAYHLMIRRKIGA